MHNKYSLEIKGNGKIIKEIYNKLVVNLNNDFKWEYIIDIIDDTLLFSVLEEEKDLYFDYINYFMDFLEKNNCFVDIEITIWRYYKYFEQCNLEFLPKDMERIGKKGVTLCMSCLDMSGDKFIHFGNKKILKDEWF